MMTGFHKYTIFVVVVLVDFTPLFKLFGGPFSFHHANDGSVCGGLILVEKIYIPQVLGIFRTKK